MAFERYDHLIFDLSSPGRLGTVLPECEVPRAAELDAIRSFVRDDLDLPEVAEPELVRHYVALSRKNYHIDQGFYPLGSCTMKYNPKVNEDAAALPGFARLHPLVSDDLAQGSLQLMHELAGWLTELTGMDDVTLQPAAGAQGELTALMMIQKHFADKGEVRDQVLTPDSAHGTNPASAAMIGFKVGEIKSDSRGRVDLGHFRKLLSPRTACVMVTNPNTLGLFESDIQEMSRLAHEAGAFMYMDGANMNALLGRLRPGDMGFDVMHLNLHKTFSTPHGGGGPGAGPVLVKKALAAYLPVPRVIKEQAKGGTTSYRFDFDAPQSIGKVHGCWGNFGMLVRAYTYILSLGLSGLSRISGIAVLNANYLKEKLRGAYDLAFEGRCMHEFVLTGTPLKEAHDVRAMDVAKRLLDYGFHAPTIYFPLIVEEAMMIEPTESESKETLDLFVDAMLKIREEIRTQPELVRGAPHTTALRRMDETRAARCPCLTYRDAQDQAESEACGTPATVSTGHGRPARPPADGTAQAQA